MEQQIEITSRISRLLPVYGITNVIGCPGSRDMPLLTAFNRNNRLKLDMVIDERSAAFSALGISEVTGRPVAIVCTSGSALLNFAPAVAEAYYKGIPLLVISADRPPEWIDQNDGQTMRQNGALGNIVKCSLTISDNSGTANCDRLLNEALQSLTYSGAGPVHLNIHLSEPLLPCPAERISGDGRKISLTARGDSLPDREIKAMWDTLSDKKVAIFIGSMPPDHGLNKALNKLAEFDNFIIIGDNVSNIHGKDFIYGIDNILSFAPSGLPGTLRPDILITAGCSPISRKFKEAIRGMPEISHWDVVHGFRLQDTYRHLERVIVSNPVQFFSQLSSARRQPTKMAKFKAEWMSLKRYSAAETIRFIKSAPWSDIKAFSLIYERIPHKWNVQCSNGMSIRYMNMFDCSVFNRFSCNRGINGIDGSTSTAVGASNSSTGITLLLSGDMSAYYDIAGLMSPLMNNRFKMVVMDNSGGDIFRCIKATSDIPERESLLVCQTKFPGERLASAAGMKYLSATDEQSLMTSMSTLIEENEKPVLLVIKTPGEINSKVYSDYINRNNRHEQI